MERAIFIVLVDFDNATHWQGFFNEHKPTKVDTLDVIRNLIEQIAIVIRELKIIVDEIWVRIYGGWHSRDEGTTDLYKWISLALSQLPLRKDGKTLRTQIVQGLYGFPGIKFQETLNKKKGLGNIRKTNAYPCGNTPCSFWKSVKQNGKSCPDANCQRKALDLFYVPNQKTVDTAICVDAINIIQDNPDSWLAIFSSDYDVLPAIIGCSRYSKNIIRLRRSDKQPNQYSASLLQAVGIVDKVVII